MHRHTFDDVLEADLAALFREDRERVGIPLDQHLVRFDLLAVLHPEMRAVDHLVALTVAALVVLHHDVAVAVHDDEVGRATRGLRALDHLEVVEARDALVLGVEHRLFRHPRRRAADVERAHRELRAGFADRLRGDDADREAEFDEFAGGQVAAVAVGADAAARLAGQHRADLHLLDAGILHFGGLVFVDDVVHVEHDVAGHRVDDAFE